MGGFETGVGGGGGGGGSVNVVEGATVIKSRFVFHFSLLQQGPVPRLETGKTNGLLFAAVAWKAPWTGRGGNSIQMYILCWFQSPSSRFKLRIVADIEINSPEILVLAVRARVVFPVDTRR